MTIISVRRIGDGQDGSIHGPHDSNITLSYRIITDNPLDTPKEVRLGIPYSWGDFLPGTGLMCQGESYNFESKGPSQSVWVVTLDFSSLQISQEEQERAQKPNPIDRRARITVRSVRYSELRNTDVGGQVKRTSAGEIYDAKEVDATRWTIHVRKNYTEIPTWIWTYQDAINDAPITVKGRQLEIFNVKFGEVVVPELQVESGVEFYPIEFTLDYRNDGWRDKRVDAGFYYLDDAGDFTRIMVADEEGVLQPSVVPTWLDGNGAKLVNPDPGDETINEFIDYVSKDFSVLPLNE